MASERLIHLVSQQKPLYDKESSDYKDAELKDKIWQEIAEQLGIGDVEAVKKMWRNLRDTYVRNKRDGQGRSGQAAIKKKKWKYMDVMAFLQSSTTKRRSDSNIEMEEEEEEEIEGEVSTEIVRASDEEGVPEMENSSGSASSSSSGAKRKKRVDCEDSIGRASADARFPLGLWRSSRQGLLFPAAAELSSSLPP
uniref:MADF domain-containing protein n=1 Tax=Knipowitschia caucasica TaxID=637954 RepID=A0AAV2MAA3_KNICA